MKKRTKIILLSCVIIATLFLIFGLSTESIDNSSSKSAAIAQFIKTYLKIDISEFIIRKCAHISEYAILGIEIIFLAGLIQELTSFSIVSCLLFGTISAVCDETIQIFSGRGSQVSDVLIDISGYLLGCAIAVFIHIKKNRAADN